MFSHVLKELNRRKKARKEGEGHEREGSFSMETRQHKETEQLQKSQNHHEEDNKLTLFKEKAEKAVSAPQYPSTDLRQSSFRDTARAPALIRAGNPQIVATNMPSSGHSPMDGVVESHEPQEPQDPQDTAGPTYDRHAQEPQKPQKVPESEGNQVSPQPEEPNTAEVKKKKAHRGRRGGKRHKKGKGKSAEQGEKSKDTKDIEDRKGNEEEWEVVDGLAEDVRE